MKLLKSIGEALLFIVLTLILAISISLPLLVVAAIGKVLFAFLGAGVVALTSGIATLLVIGILIGSVNN